MKKFVVARYADGRMARTHADQRSDWVRLFRESNLSIESFARQRGLRVSTLRRWLGQVGRHPPSPPEFRQIVLPPLVASPSSSGWDAELSLSQGGTLRLRGDLAREIALVVLGAHRS